MGQSFSKVSLCILALVSILGCSTIPSSKKSITQLYEEAYKLYQKESYTNAKEKFEEIVQRDPLNKYSVLSEFHLADILYKKGNFSESMLHYGEYLRLNPKGAEAEEALFKIGMCHFNMIRSYDRDQTDTNLAVEKLDNYIKRYPNGKYTDDASKNIKIALETKLKSENNVGMFYYKSKKYNAAVVRFERILNTYKSGDLLEEARITLADSRDKFSNEERLKDEKLKSVSNKDFLQDEQKKSTPTPAWWGCAEAVLTDCVVPNLKSNNNELDKFKKQ